MIKRNYKSDFKLTIPLTDAEGREVVFPKFDWIARFWTVSRAISYEASCRDGKFRNAAVDSEGRLVVYFDNHGLPPGYLHLEFAVDIPDEGFADGFQRVESTIALDVELVRGRTKYTAAEVEATVPVIIRSALESEAIAFGKVLDKINRRLSVMLGDNPGGDGQDADENEERTEARLSDPVFLQRGIIPIGAMPGVVYRNLGYIRLPVVWPQEVGDVRGRIDVSGVDPTLMRGLSFRRSGMTFYDGPNTADGDKLLSGETREGFKYYAKYNSAEKCVEYSFGNVSSVYRPSLRLVIHNSNTTGPSAEYLKRDSDGIIRATGRPRGLVEQREPAAPEIPNTAVVGSCLADVIVALFGGVSGLIEVQVKKRNRDHKPRWRAARIGGSGAVWDKRMGVARVRYAQKGRRKASRWSVFTFRRSRSLTHIRPLG